MDRPKQGEQRNASLIGMQITPTDLDLIRGRAVELFIYHGHVNQAWCWVTAVDLYLSSKMSKDSSKKTDEAD